MTKFCFKSFMLFWVTAATLFCVSCSGDDVEPDRIPDLDNFKYTEYGYFDGQLYYDWWGNHELAITKADKNCQTVFVPVTVKYGTMDVYVGAIGDYAFSDCRELTKISMPSIWHIGDGAFAGCSSLASITIEGNVGHDAFAGCSGLTSVNWNSKYYLS